jgi:hypothetical protein
MMSESSVKSTRLAAAIEGIAVVRLREEFELKHAPSRGKL